MKRTRKSFFASRGGAVIPALLATIALAVAIFVSLDWAAAYRIELTRQGWERTLGSWDAVLERHPAREVNASALEVERLGAELGIDVATRTRADAVRPSREQVAAYRKIRGETGKYVQAQIERPSRGVDPPPDGVADYLDGHRSTLQALREHLVHGDTPYWEQRLEDLHGAPVPNLIGHIDLQRLLVADVLARVHAGDREGALAALDASWHLNLAFRDDPILITQLVSIMFARMHAGTLRQMEDVPAIWSRRLSEHDFRETLLAALQVEAQVMMHLGEYSTLGLDNSVLQRAAWTVAKPYIRFCAASISDDFRRRLARLAEAEALCSGDSGYHGVDLNVPVPRWNLLGKIAVPYLGGALQSVARLELDQELTGKILEIESSRLAGGGAWPHRVPGMEASAACPEARWGYSVDRAGSMTIAFSHELTWPDQHGTILPMRFSVER